MTAELLKFRAKSLRFQPRQLSLSKSRAVPQFDTHPANGSDVGNDLAALPLREMRVH